MKLSIDQQIANQTREQIIDAIYYAMRYIKQAARARRMDKDIFQDADRSLPSSATQALTMAIVREIEGSVGMKAESFDGQTFTTVFTFLSAVATSQRGEMSEDDRREAEALAAELSADPTLGPTSRGA
jgi:hypothetical protein